MKTYHNVLVPLDGSQLGEWVLPLALSVAQRAEASLCLAHVAVASAKSADMQAYLDALATRLRAATATRMGAHQLAVGHAAVSDRLTAFGQPSVDTQLPALAGDVPPEDSPRITTALLEVVPTNPLVPSGPQRIAAVLNNYAAAHGIDLIVMASHGRGGLSRLWLGSVADALLHEARIPLLLQRPEEALVAQDSQAGFAHILIPLDGSPLAEHAITPALALGTPGYTRYTLLQTISPLLAEHTVPPYGAGLLYDERPALEADAHAYLARIAAAIRPQAAQVRTQVVVADPADAILACAREQRVDLIALATHGRSIMARGILGSVADRVARNADNPVLLYRPAGVPQWQHPFYGM